jgi:hypothetical protein
MMKEGITIPYLDFDKEDFKAQGTKAAHIVYIGDRFSGTGCIECCKRARNMRTIRTTFKLRATRAHEQVCDTLRSHT